MAGSRPGAGESVPRTTVVGREVSDVAREFARVGVVGLGTMGAGIVEVFARGGIEVVGVEVDEAAASRGRETLEASTQRAVDR